MRVSCFNRFVRQIRSFVMTRVCLRVLQQRRVKELIDRSVALPIAARGLRFLHGGFEAERQLELQVRHCVGAKYRLLNEMPRTS